MTSKVPENQSPVVSLKFLYHNQEDLHEKLISLQEEAAILTEACEKLEEKNNEFEKKLLSLEKLLNEILG